LSEKSSLRQQREINFCWGKILNTERCSRRERSGVTWLLAGIWKLTGIRRNKGKENALYIYVKRMSNI
jgi:hypothetical protein